MTLKELTQKLKAEKSRIGLVSSGLKIDEYPDAEHNVSAHINPQNWDIEITIKKGFNPITDTRQRIYAKKKGIESDKGLETLLTTVCNHEFGHWELPLNSGMGCPFDTYNHDKILEATKKELAKFGKEDYSGYVTNAFEDIMVNARVKEWQGDLAGQVLFWDNEGKSSMEKGEDHYTLLYEAFVKLNMHLSGDKWDSALLKRYYSGDEKVTKAVERVIKDLNMPKNINNTSYLFNQSRWPKMARLFAKNVAGLLDKPPKERLSAHSNNEEDESGAGKSNKQQQIDKKSGNPIEEKAKTSEGKSEIAYQRYKNNEPQSPNITSFEQLDSLYKQLAQPLQVRVEAKTRPQELDIAPLTRRPFDEEVDDINRILLSKLYVTEEGITFAYQREPLAVQAREKHQRKSFPSFKMILFDNSWSMQEAIDDSGIGNDSFIPWGDNSKYHHALRGFYGIEKYLQQQGIAQYIKHGFLAFSDTTRINTGSYSDLDEIRKLALEPEFGGTSIDASILKQSLSGKDSFVLSLSDGEIQGWESVKENFLELAKQSYYAHIQIGGSKPKFVKDLEAAGIPVFYATSGEQLSRLMVDISAKTYNKFIRCI